LGLQGAGQGIHRESLHFQCAHRDGLSARPLIAGGKFLVLRKALVASGYIHRLDPVTFEVGPTGLVYDAQNDILYVASTGDNEVFAVLDAGDRTTAPPNGKGTVIYADNAHLHGALAMAQAPNGHLLVRNSDGINPDPNQPNEIVEFTVRGQFIGELSVDATPGGAFGLSLVGLNDDKIRFAAVDDNANVLKLMTVNVPDLLSTP
jgi:DNA-binding beta-propeller fold protein YncE